MLKIFDIRWIKDHVAELYDHLQESEDTKKYKNEMITAILSESDYTLQMLPQLMLSLTQIVLTLIHHLYVMQDGYEFYWSYIVSTLLLILNIQQLVHEYIQLKRQGWKNYFY